LSGFMDRIVLNKTELDGKYDFAMKWNPDPADSPDLPGIFTALQDQLGLKLESSKRPVEVVVIDNVETPGEN
jgi:bla regulator protein BlaR1